MYNRHLIPVLQTALKSFRGLYVHGPRQTGKTTMCKLAFPDMPYATLENPEERRFAHEDPKGFLARYPKGAVLDEIQRAPELLSYLQEILDGGKARFVITGSQNLLLAQGISQSLAGRLGIFLVLPLSRAEKEGRACSDPGKSRFTGKGRPRKPVLMEELFYGGFPEPSAKPKIRDHWHSAYIQSYLERDVRDLLKVQDLQLFQRFLGLAAGRSGQLLNVASLALDTGVSEAQCRRWIALLQASEIAFLLPPFFENINKRLIKSPKFFLVDSGLQCHLLGIPNPETLARHPLLGAVFETFMVNEIRKCLLNRGQRPREFFFRDKTGVEVDYLLDGGDSVLGIEFKASETLVPEHFRNLEKWRDWRGNRKTEGMLLHGGDSERELRGFRAIPYWKL